MTELTGLGFTLPRETVQPALDSFTAQLTKNYPMGIQADSVKVTDNGVESQFSTQNATIPKERGGPLLRGPLTVSRRLAPPEAVDVLAHIHGELQVGAGRMSGPEVPSEFVVRPDRRGDQRVVVLDRDHDDDSKPDECAAESCGYSSTTTPYPGSYPTMALGIS